MQHLRQFFALLVVVVLGYANPTKITIGMVYDKGDLGIENILVQTLEHVDNETVTLTVRMWEFEIDDSIINTEQLFSDYLKRYSNINFVLDFTRSYNTSHGIRNVLIRTGFPSVSTNTHQDLAEPKRLPQIVRAGPPETMAQIEFRNAMRGYGGAIFLDKFGVIVATPNDTKPNKEPMTQILAAKPLDQLLEKFQPTKIFLMGSHAESKKLMDGVSNYKSDWIKPGFQCDKTSDIPKLKSEPGTLFTERFSWWSISTIHNENFTCPDYIESMTLVNMELATKAQIRLTQNLQNYRTNNITDLYYADVIHIAIKSFVTMSAKGTWNNRNLTEDVSTFELNWMRNIAPDFAQEDNLLGQYRLITEFSPEYIFRLSYATPTNISHNITEVKSGRWRVYNRSAFGKAHAPYYIGVTIVVDPPFVYNGNDICKDGTKDKAEIPNYFGFVTDFIENIMLELNLRIYFISEAPYGSYNSENKTWSGAIGTLVNKEADMILGALKVTRQRAEVVTMSTPFFTDRSNNNATYAFAFRKEFNPMIGTKINQTIWKLKSSRVFKQLNRKWFQENPCNVTVSTNH